MCDHVMAENVKDDVTCGVNEQDRKHVVLMYEVDDPLNRIIWEWLQEPNEDGTLSYIAQLSTLDSKRRHRSHPIPDVTYKKLGSPKIKKVGGFIRVKLSRIDRVSVEQYFNY